MAVHSSLFVTNQINKKELEFLESYPEFLYWSALIVRLQDDLGTSSEELKRGDVAKSIQCYMHENGVSEEAARRHIKNVVREAWKMLNVQRLRGGASPLSQAVSGSLLNLVRGAHCFYQHGDGHGSQNHLTKHHALSLLFDPIPLYNFTS
ncbi:terpene synthase 10 [Hibiscus trionum]|uniref:Terpene synthase 10 n=1 Tax=Hibiscus trionum TaxID=183268 RepID=A0A9W7H1D7_HIBTR|nr:terpene synthase 10 [Hibiscus trionum]